MTPRNQLTTGNRLLDSVLGKKGGQGPPPPNGAEPSSSNPEEANPPKPLFGLKHLLRRNVAKPRLPSRADRGTAGPVYRRNRLIIGSTQFGKSTAALSEVVGPAILGGKVAVLVADTHSRFGNETAEFALAKGQGFRTVVVDLSDITWVFSFGFCDKPDPNLPWREFRQQVFERAREVAELAISQRGPEYGGLDGKVNVKKYTILAIAAWMFSAEDLPLAQLPFALKPGTTEFDRILNTCRDPETRQALLEMAALWNPRRPEEFHRTVAPAERLIDELFNDETLRAYGEATADLEEVLKNKGIICFTGGTNEYTTRVILRSVWQRLIRVLKRHWKRSGEKPLPVLFAADECSTYTGEPEAQSLAECLKMMTDPDTGEGGFVLISQTPDFGSPSVNLKVSQCCSWKAFFHCAGLVAPLAAVELKGGLNPLQVKRVRKKIEHTGQFEAVKVYSQSKRKDKDGKDLVEERENTVFQPVYREVEEEELWSLSDLVHLADMGLQRLRVGECWVRDGAEVSFRKVPAPAALWTFDGQGRRMLEEHARRQREQGVFRRVADTTPPLPPAPPASTPPSPAPSRPAAGSRRPPRGMS